MIEFLLSWLVLSFGVWAAAALLPSVHIKSFKSAIIVAAALGVLNVLIGWLLFVIIGIGTLGLGFLFAFLTRLVVSAILLKIIDAAMDSLRIESFGASFLMALIIAVIGGVADWLIF